MTLSHTFVSLNAVSFSSLNICITFCLMWPLGTSQTQCIHHTLVSLAALGTGANPHPNLGLLSLFFCLLLTDWVDYFSKVSAKPSPAGASNLWWWAHGGAVGVCPQPPWDDGGIWWGPFVSIPEQPAAKIHWFPADWSVVFNNALWHKWLYRIIQSNPGSLEGVVPGVTVWDLFWCQERSFHYLSPRFSPEK